MTAPQPSTAATAWYTIRNIDEVDTPALVVYLDRVKRNIERLKGMIDDVQRLRPHVKTHKTREATLLLLEAGIGKFKCATIAEAEMLASLRAPDVLLAYQPVGPKVQRFLSLMKEYPATKFSCLLDNEAAAEALSAAAVHPGRTIPVYIDLNVGMNRTGIAPDERAVALYARCAELPGLQPLGLHAYDGHIRDADVQVRAGKCDAAFAHVERLRDALMEDGFAEPTIVAGGSPTFPLHARRAKVECSPGTFIFWDAGYGQQLADQPFEPAALVVTRVISLPAHGIVCADLGHKSIASENPLDKRVSFYNAPDLQPIGQSEEHLVLETGPENPYQVGDVLYGVPYHICPTCALYERMLVVEDGVVTTEWRTMARDRRIQV